MENNYNNEFMNLCRKYPDVIFIGNTTFNIYLLKKGSWVINTEDKKMSFIAITKESKSIIYNNKFIGITGGMKFINPEKFGILPTQKVEKKYK